MPDGDWKTATCVAGLRRNRIDAPCVIDGPMNGEVFLAYVDKLWDTIGLLVEAFSPDECKNDLGNCGYMKPARESSKTFPASPGAPPPAATAAWPRPR